MSNKYTYFSRYELEGLENHEFTEIIIPIENTLIKELCIYRQECKVLADFEIKEDVGNIKNIEKECVLLIQRMFYKLFLLEVYVPKILYVHVKSSYPMISGNVSASITLRSEIDFHGESVAINFGLLKGFEKLNVSNPSYKHLECLLGIKEKSYRFVALYQFLTEGKSIEEFIEYIKRKGLLQKYDIKMRNNPDNRYRNLNPKLDDLSYLRTIIAHFHTNNSCFWKNEYEKMIDENMRKIILIIKEYF
ncbi:hypothetical protein NE689_00375 [Lactonifactor longoviformis]|uniref:hypothetical protein n=1 Tax=Lactonifactor longoviformis TaxID=341220 RepID=UPI0021092E42|nr:hypothetical protein [Lactonifactor longoviformis]MCQ4669755.1 hypothetical protein [Lactonifactor longoviformis]